MKIQWLLSLQLLLASTAIHAADDRYEILCRIPSDINEHLPLLRELATQCSSVVEIPLRHLVATAGLLQGLSENPNFSRSYVAIDAHTPPRATLDRCKQFAEANEIAFSFWQDDIRYTDIPETELLFIDAIPTNGYLTDKLERLSRFVSRTIAIHNTSEPWGDEAVVDFLARHPEWRLQEKHLNNHGLTILTRSSIKP